MLNFSSGTNSKHPPGIQPVAACKSPEQEADCRINDNGIRNQHGVWFLPGQTSAPPPEGFQDLKYVYGRKMPV